MTAHGPGRCPSCSTPMEPGAMFCVECGAMPQPFRPASHCWSCRREIDSGERYCGYCGVAQTAPRGGRPGGIHDDVTDAQVTLGRHLPPAIGGDVASGTSGGFFKGSQGDDTDQRSATPTPTPYPVADASPSRTRPAALVVVAVLAVIALVTTLTLLVANPSNDDSPSASDGRTRTGSKDEHAGRGQSPQGVDDDAADGTPDGGAAAPDLAGLNLPRQDVPCTDDSTFYVILATGAVGDLGRQHLVDKLTAAASSHPDARYMSLRASCEHSFSHKEPNGAAYQAYLGPFPDFGDACTAQQTTIPGTFIKNVAGDAPLKGSSYCFCRASVSTLDTVPYGTTDSFLVSDAQQVLNQEGFNPERAIFGNYFDDLAAQLAEYQAARSIVGSGLDQATWQSLQQDGCG